MKNVKKNIKTIHNLYHLNQRNYWYVLVDSYFKNLTNIKNVGMDNFFNYIGLNKNRLDILCKKSYHYKDIKYVFYLRVIDLKLRNNMCTIKQYLTQLRRIKDCYDVGFIQ